jgi:hypothetical protein
MGPKSAPEPSSGPQALPECAAAPKRLQALPGHQRTLAVGRLAST